MRSLGVSSDLASAWTHGLPNDLPRCIEQTEPPFQRKELEFLRVGEYPPDGPFKPLTAATGGAILQFHHADNAASFEVFGQFHPPFLSKQPDSFEIALRGTARARLSDDLYRAVRPMLAVSGGALWLMSTPFGKRGFFHETWTKGGPGWLRIQATARECPRIAPEFLEEERAAMGDRWFRQEYLCEFDDVASGVFDSELVERAISDEVRPLVFA